MGFDNISFQDTIINIIKNGLENNKLSQSLLFYGESFSGKLTTALSIAKALNCINSKGSDFCDNCISCKKIEKFSHPDVFVIDSDNYYQKFSFLYNIFQDSNINVIKEFFLLHLNRFYSRTTAEYFALRSSVAGKKFSKIKMLEIIEQYQEKIIKSNSISELKKNLDKKINKMTFLENIKYIEKFHNLGNIPIQTVKDLMGKMNLSLTEGKRKVFIFNGIDLMRNEGCNAFLKSIEEPPKNSQIILITSKISKILQTIKSRCYQMAFRKRNLNDIVNVYSSVYNINFANLPYDRINDLFKYFPEIKYKNYLLGFIATLHNIKINKNKNFKILSIITKYSNLLHNSFKSLNKEDLFILKQVIVDFLYLIKLAKKSYNISNFVEQNLIFQTEEEKRTIVNDLDSVLEDYIKYNIYTIDSLIDKNNEIFNFIVYNNIDVDMSMTNFLLELCQQI